ncbi:GEVED domain-containing protein [Spirosoma foliorum]|uniref:Uncharacterized protein n=1 Tax=Spirosoma foliorum TaxID=2710596 RepID=A0A7G5GPT3_9BACT|nr:GEVED domain-containing protein [Spirosoma foliorum]QMW00875.1 hypothetical protein H3H32_23225 [Spirosoma foliorum]
MSRVTQTLGILLLIQLLLLAGQSRAQAICGIPQLTDDQLIWQEKLLAHKHSLPAGRRAAQLQYIPIRFHVVRQNDGTGGADIASLNQALVLINQLYQPINIAFYLCGKLPHYINNTALFDYDNTEESLLSNANDVSNAINVYLVNTLTYAGSEVTGYAYYPNAQATTNRVFLKASQLTDYTLAHELGHYFNLYHTFQNNQSSTIANRELVIRPGDALQGRPFGPNCTTAGDFVCDTPADPYGLTGATLSGCSYTGTSKDANGDLFNPLIANIMSYYFSCGMSKSFTAGQYARMTDGLSLRLDPGNAYALNCVDSSVLTPTGLSASIQGGETGVQLQFSYSGTNAAGFLIERSLDPTANFTVIGSLPSGSFSYTDGTVLSNTTYYYRVKASNATTQYSAVASVKTGQFYCVPTYTWPIANFFPRIDDFILTGSQSTLRSVATGIGVDGYSDFSDVQHKVQAGHVYSFTASAITGNVGSYIKQHLTIWLDSNQDGTFSDTEKLFQSSASQYLTPSLTGTLTIPASFSAGQTRLRLRSQYYADGLVESPCDPYNYGEAEDYTLVIDNPTPPSCFSLSALAIPATCAGKQDGIVSLLLVGGTAPFSYSLGNQISTTGTFAGLLAGSYTATVANAGCSQSLVVTVGQPAAFTTSISSSATSVCSGQSLTLVASAGSQYRWNTGQTGASLVVAASGAYSVTVTSVVGCTSVASTSVLVTNCVLLYRAKVLLEGFTNATTGLMHSLLISNNLLPKQQPYSSAPWSYTGSEQVTTFPSNVTDWVLVVARNAAGEVLFQTAAFVRNDGTLIRSDGTEGVVFSTSSEPMYASIHHRNHLAILSGRPMTDNQLVDFTTDATAVKGTSQLKSVGSKLVMYSGDYDANDVINSADYNKWKVNASIVGHYLSIDADGNGIINNQDFNRWVLNRSKIGTPGL